MLVGLSLLHSLRGQSRLLTGAHLLQAGLSLLLNLKYQSVLPTWGSFAAGGQLSSAVSEANLRCWLRFLCCRRVSLSSAVSQANLLMEAHLLQVGLSLLCSLWRQSTLLTEAHLLQVDLFSVVSDAILQCWLRASLSSVVSDDNHSLLCCKTACLWSADLAARWGLSVSLCLLNRISLCSAISEARCSLSCSFLWHSLSFLLLSDSVVRGRGFTDSGDSKMIWLPLAFKKKFQKHPPKPAEAEPSFRKVTWNYHQWWKTFNPMLQLLFTVVIRKGPHLLSQKK